MRGRWNQPVQVWIDEFYQTGLPEFERETQRLFEFLVAQYGYVLLPTAVTNQNYWPDTMASVQYVGAKVKVAVEWLPMDAYVGVRLTDLLDARPWPGADRHLPQSGSHPRFIHLHALANLLGREYLFLSDNMLQTPYERRLNLIESSLVAVLSNLADVLRETGSRILAGDTSLFPAVQAYWEVASQRGIRGARWKDADGRTLELLVQIAGRLWTYGRDEWSTRLTEMAEELHWALDSGDRDRILRNYRDIRKAFGGMGSLNDIYLTHLAGDDIAEDDEAAANEELRSLEDRLFAQVASRSTRLQAWWRRVIGGFDE